MNVKRAEKEAVFRLWCFITLTLIVFALAVAKTTFSVRVSEFLINFLIGVWLVLYCHTWAGYVQVQAAKDTAKFMKELEDATNPDLPRKRPDKKRGLFGWLKR